MKDFETKITIQELKLCPWCGKLPIVDVGENVIIMCPDARVRIFLDFHEIGGRCPSPSCIIAETFNEALTKWNGERKREIISPLQSEKDEALCSTVHDLREAARKNKELFDYASTITSPWHELMDGRLVHKKLIEMITAVEIALVGGKK